jgi:hypothetical protein
VYAALERRARRDVHHDEPRPRELRHLLAGEPAQRDHVVERLARSMPAQPCQASG